MNNESVNLENIILKDILRFRVNVNRNIISNVTVVIITVIFYNITKKYVDYEKR
jgi:hypothetical protein